MHTHQLRSMRTHKLRSMRMRMRICMGSSNTGLKTGYSCKYLAAMKASILQLACADDSPASIATTGRVLLLPLPLNQWRMHSQANRGSYSVVGTLLLLLLLRSLLWLLCMPGTTSATCAKELSSHLSACCDAIMC
jgi:hypothetical protein